jgi:hypothetical protein
LALRERGANLKACAQARRAGTMSPRVQSGIGVALLLLIFAIVTWRALIS